jgi:hypothetical protein
VIWVKREAEYFCAHGWTGQIALIAKAFSSSPSKRSSTGL